MVGKSSAKRASESVRRSRKRRLLNVISSYHAVFNVIHHDKNTLDVGRAGGRGGVGNATDGRGYGRTVGTTAST